MTYHFPPDAEIGGVRPFQVARHLPQFGMEPWVLTVEPRFAESLNIGLVTEGVPDDHIIRTFVDKTPFDRVLDSWRATRRLGGGKERGAIGDALSPPTARRFGEWARHWLAFPDERFGWYRPALRAADEVIRRVGFDAIISTSPPRVATLIAANLARRHHLPWVMDLRDPWWGWYETLTSRDDPAPTIGFLQERLFCRCVRRASLVVHNTERLRQLTCQIVPQAEPKTRCIPNGCDTDGQAPRTGALPTTFRIGYYGQIMGRRNPAAFLQGLRRWLDSARPDPPRVAVRFVGSGFDDLVRQVQALELSRFVEILPGVPRQEVPDHLAADFVLLLVANAQPLQVPGKTYEYLAAGRRILALTDHDGATADLLKAQEGCVVAEGAEEVRAALERFYLEYQGGAEAWIDRTALLADLQYPRRVEQFAELLREIVPAGPWTVLG